MGSSKTARRAIRAIQSDAQPSVKILPGQTRRILMLSFYTFSPVLIERAIDFLRIFCYFP